MNRAEFEQWLSEFAKLTKPDRHVYIWQHTERELSAGRSQGFVVKLNLHQLCRESAQQPNNLKAAQTTVTTAIERWLVENFPKMDGQRVLAVSGCDLLARYQVSLGPFVQVGRDRRAVVFCAPVEDSRYQPNRPWPDYVQFRPDATLQYLKVALTDEFLIGV